MRLGIAIAFGSLGCGTDGASSDGGMERADADSPVNGAPVWQGASAINFTIGGAEAIHLASRVIDPDGDTITVDVLDGELAGVSFDPASVALRYDGSAPERTGSLSFRATDEHGASSDRVFDIRVRERGPLCSTIEWQSVPFDEITVLDHADAVLYQGSPLFHVPWRAKHTRIAFRPANGRVYEGFGDYTLEGGESGLPNQVDVERDSAQPAFFSYDPLDPLVYRKEQGSYIEDPARMQETGADEGAVDWDLTRDRLLLSPVDAFLDFEVATDHSVEIVGPRTLRVGPGDLTGSYLVDTRIGLRVTHPRAGDYVHQGRVESATVDGGATLLQVRWHDDDFDLGRVVVEGISIAHKNVRGAWMISARTVYHESTDVEYAVLLAWDPETRLWERLLFEPLFSPDFATWNSWAVKNARFIPASVTGRHDELHAVGNLGNNFYTWILDLEDLTIDKVVTDLSFDSASVDQVTTAFDGERYLYTFSVFDSWLLRWDVVEREVERVVQVLDAEGAPFASGHVQDKTWLAFDDIARVLQILCQPVEAADDAVAAQHLLIFDPRDGAYEDCGTALPDGSPINTRAVGRAGDRTVFSGGMSPAQRQMIVTRR